MIRSEDHGRIRVLTIESGAVNALDLDTLLDLRTAIDDAATASAVVLAGTDTVFCAGVDLARLLDEGPDYTREFFVTLEDLVERLFTVPVPVVGALTGHAIAGGCLLAAACDHRVMGQGRIGVTEILVGFPLPPGCLEVLRHRSGVHTTELVTTGRTVHPDEALTLGLIDEIVAPEMVLDRSIAVAESLAAAPARTYELHKRMLRAPAVEQLQRARRDHSEDVLDAWLREDHRDRARSFLASLSKR